MTDFVEDLVDTHWQTGNSDETIDLKESILSLFAIGTHT